MRSLLCRLLTVSLVVLPALSHAMLPPVREVVAAHVPPTDSLRAHTLSLLKQGQVAEAIEYWSLTTGKEAPSWLLTLRTAFDASRQVAGRCQEVARTLHTALTKLGERPEFVELRTLDQNRVAYIIFKTANGSDVNVSVNGYHVLIRLGGRAYDAYTGAAGLPWAEYMSRLGARSDLTMRVVETLATGPL